MDCRDREAMMGRWYERFEESNMTLVVLHYNDEDEEIETELPASFQVCNLCDGKGNHTNPSVDAHGLGAEDFDDYEFRESYFSGAYDVTCYRCGGKRVEPVLDEVRATKEQKQLVDKILQRQYDDARERESEMRYGY